MVVAGIHPLTPLPTRNFGESINILYVENITNLILLETMMGFPVKVFAKNSRRWVIFDIVDQQSDDAAWKIVASLKGMKF